MSGPLAAVERFFERLFERPAARLFQPQLEVVQIERALERVMESERRVQSRRSYVPTTYRVLLNEADVTRLDGDLRVVARDLAESLRVYARAHGYHLLAQPRVEIGSSSTVQPSDVRAYAEPFVLPADGSANGNGHGPPQGLGRAPDVPPGPPRRPTWSASRPPCTPRPQSRRRAPSWQSARPEPR